MALARSTDPLVWIDCEMTGLNPETDTILSISCILTTSTLQPLDTQGFDAVIPHTQEQLSSMSGWCITHHGDSGLTDSCLQSTTSAEEAATNLLAYIRKYIAEPRRALLAGNSIHADKSFLAKEPWSQILEHLHYRLFDVSAMKEMVRRWAPLDILERAPRKEMKHTAREDVEESIEEAAYYMGLIQGLGSGVGLNVDMPGGSKSANVLVGDEGQGRPLTTGTKQGQEAIDMMRNNGNKLGDAGGDEGFRTDVP